MKSSYVDKVSGTLATNLAVLFGICRCDAGRVKMDLEICVYDWTELIL